MQKYFNPRGCISLDSSGHPLSAIRVAFQSTRLYKPRRRCIMWWWYIVVFQSTRLYKPRPIPFYHVQAATIFQSTRLYKPRHRHHQLSKYYKYFNPRGCISLDNSNQFSGAESGYFNPRGCISLDSKNIQKIYSKLFPNTTIIQHLLNFITIQLQYILKFHYYLQKFGANPPAN